MKKFLSIAFSIAVLLAPAFATSVASIKGVYSFQVESTQNQYGYYKANSNTFVPLTNGVCPAGQHCLEGAVTKLTVGTISFDGLGHAKFLTIANYGNGGNGPKVGTVWAYTVSGLNGYLGPAGNGAALKLGVFSTAGVAQVLQLLTTDIVPSIGTAIKQQ